MLIPFNLVLGKYMAINALIAMYFMENPGEIACGGSDSIAFSFNTESMS